MSKIWKKLLLAILIIACLFNVVSKIVKRYSLKEELESSAQYMEQRYENIEKELNKEKSKNTILEEQDNENEY